MTDVDIAADTLDTLAPPRAVADKRRFHRLLGKRKSRINYSKSDFLDYALMIAACAAVLIGTYGLRSWLGAAGCLLCVFMLASFVVRHGVAFRVPVVLRRPLDVLFMLVHKVDNTSWVYWAALGFVVLENVGIELTPGLPHHAALMRRIGLWLFGLHLAIIFAYRTRSLVDHWRKRDIVSKVLLESPWKNAGLVRESIRYEIVHAYSTGLLTHLILVAPWYLAITYLKFSVLFMPVTCAVNLWLHLKFLKAVNAWFYRDHWLGHNSELEFVYLHGSHHDAIPVGLIAVAGNGFLEGLLRNLLGYPTPFYNPVMAFVAYTLEILRDIDFHQFVPGIFPKMRLEFRQVGQHSTHHFGHLEPYGFGVKLDQPGLSADFVRLFARFPEEFNNSIRLDEELTGFDWNNPRFQWFLGVCKEHE